MKPVHILPILAFKDNYIWMIHDSQRAVVVDPGQSEPVIKALKEHGLELHAIVLTHLHYDHNLGVPGLLHDWKVPVYGPVLNDHDRVSHPPFPKPGTTPLDCVNHVVGEGDVVALQALGVQLKVLAVPGHTKGHLAFLDEARGWLFTGDTLFGGGCGKVFGGSMVAMRHSLDRLADLPGRTLVFCAHEYTMDNLKFALEVEPSNPDLLKRLQADALKRSLGQPTLPSTISMERATNPFLRVMEPEIVETLNKRMGGTAYTRDSNFEALRLWKNQFQS
ncbi:hydroxyacylglutathione hydrolase [Herbaspirillum huttiense]|uniref:hydroxyacylglutathione hydrolase n=1 Tax=Herbaspirillum huttiense TaxID=863372 RepID=UPI0039AEA982